MFGRIWRRVKRNPVLVGGAVVGLLELGMDVTDEQTAAIAVVAALIVRSFVTPTSDPKLPARETISG